MIKKLSLLAALALTGLPAAASAAPGDYLGGCNPSIFSAAINNSPATCYGFFSGNQVTGLSPLTPAAITALGALGISPVPTTMIEKIDVWNGTSDLATMLYGETVVGIHWGNYLGNDDPSGNVTAFYKFDAGTGGIKNLGLTALTGISNIGVYKTGTQEVPEPASLALVAAGVLGLAGVARRRNTV